jgi:phage shock protein A
MSDVITEYKKWKQQGEDLQVQAKQAMEARYHELLAEAVQIAKEYRADFGEPLKPPSPITSFRYKGSAKSKAKKAAVERPTAKNLREVPQPAPSAAKPNAEIVGLQKRLAAEKKKHDKAKASGKPTKAVEDRIYEIEDELRLAGQT